MDMPQSINFKKEWDDLVDGTFFT